METSPENRESCHACGVRMDVSALPPFTMIECPHCGAQTRVKSRFGPFKLVRRHAVGGMSMVFAAHDETLDREVALKILNEDYSADERRIAAFEQEARLTASFSHPNVVRLFTTGRAFGRFYIAMEMVPGGHLEQRVHDLGKIPEAEMLRLAIEVARGLKAAKTAGLIHRDVKPGNILLDGEGHAKLVDFGLALVTQGGKARASELWATPYYVPPETVDGEDEDFRSDIYAFGATLYHTLAGKPPCGEESMSTDALREAKKHVPPLEKIDPSISADTCKLVNKAMAYSAADRHVSYDELIADLTNALNRLKNGNAVPAATRRMRERRKRLLMPVAMGGIAVIAAVAWFSWMLTHRGKQEPGIVQTPVIPPPPPPVDEVDHSAEIARGFREARAALEAMDYEKAGQGFMALHGNVHVHEPTRTWAGLEAVLAAFLDGRSGDARGKSAVALEHVRTLPADHPLAGETWIKLLEGVAKLEPLKTSAADQSVSAMVAAMLAGLKNWEQGMTDAAAESFRKVADAKLAEEDGWAVFYQKLAANYLADHEILKSPLFTEEPADAAGCLKTISQLDEALAMLKTRGRARYNLRAWQLDLKRRSHLLEAREAERARTAEVKPPPAPTLDEVLARLAEFSGHWRFAEAITYLKELSGDPPGASRDSLAAVAEAAQSFLTEIGKDLAKEPFAGDLTMKDGRMVKGLAAANGSLRATMSGGENIACELSDFSADALIALHRVLVKRPAGEAERQHRHECAIAFDWLAGDRQRALAAAANLASSSPVFKKHWETIAEGLPE
jgi:eukaryotic-like serine/threonine-protein kinase